MEIRKSTLADVPRMMEIYARAREFMKDTGNPRQWYMRSWPPESLILSDIEAGKSYVCTDGERIVGTFFYTSGPSPEPTYREIDGEWIGSDDYGVVHRIASDGTKGVGTFCINWAYDQCGHLRIDTHPDNRVMQSLLAKLGFTRCGLIKIVEDSDPRIAYEKL